VRVEGSNLFARSIFLNYFNDLGVLRLYAQNRVFQVGSNLEAGNTTRNILWKTS